KKKKKKLSTNHWFLLVCVKRGLQNMTTASQLSPHSQPEEGDVAQTSSDLSAAAPEYTSTVPQADLPYINGSPSSALNNGTYGNPKQNSYRSQNQKRFVDQNANQSGLYGPNKYSHRHQHQQQ